MPQEEEHAWCHICDAEWSGPGAHKEACAHEDEADHPCHYAGEPEQPDAQADAD